MSGLAVALLLSFDVAAHAAATTGREELRVFTDKDMYELSQKISKNLHRCKQLRWRPDIIVEVENKTDEFFDKTKFSNLIHSQLEAKSHRSMETTPPDFEVRVELEEKTIEGRNGARIVYTLSAQVFQAEEKLCEKKAAISKRVSLKSSPIDLEKNRSN